MSKLISIRDDLYELLKGETKSIQHESGVREVIKSFSDVLDELLEPLQETTVTQEGRISKTLAGKTILFKIKEE